MSGVLQNEKVNLFNFFGRPCSYGNEVDKGIPVIEEFFYTNDLSNVLSPDISGATRLKTIKVNNVNSETFDYRYTMVITFKDADLDVTAMHYSWDGFETTDRVLNINQIYDWQTNRWDGIAWKWRGDVIPISVYIEDALGNRSEIYEYNVNTIIMD